MPIELFPMRKTRKEVTHILISHYPERAAPGPGADERKTQPKRPKK